MTSVARRRTGENGQSSVYIDLKCTRTEHADIWHTDVDCCIRTMGSAGIRRNAYPAWGGINCPTDKAVTLLIAAWDTAFGRRPMHCTEMGTSYSGGCTKFPIQDFRRTRASIEHHLDRSLDNCGFW